MNKKLYKMDTYEGLPRILICSYETDYYYIALKKDVHGRYYLTEHCVCSDGRFYDQWRNCDASLKGQSYDTLEAIIGFFIARCSSEAFNEYIETIEYDGADTEDPEPDNDFKLFIEEVESALK